MSKKLLALLLAMIMVIGSFTSVLAEETKKPEDPKATEVKTDEKKDEAKPEEKTEEKVEEKAEVKDEALARAIEVLKKGGFIKGFKEGAEEFGEDKNITRAQFAAMVVRALGAEESAKALQAVTSQFTDVSYSHWANGYIAVAKTSGIINGYPNGSFMPSKQISYNEMAAMLVRMLKLEKPGMMYPASYVMAAQQAGLFKDVAVTNYKNPATRGDVFKMFYNTITNKEFGERKILKAIVLENSRVEKIAEDEIVAEVIQVVQEANWVEANRDKRGDQHKYVLDKDLKLDPEDMIGKVYDITVDKNDKIVEVKKDDSYKYLDGQITDVNYKKFELEGTKYTALFDERYASEDERLYRTYLNDKDYKYEDFAAKYVKDGVGDYDYARVTVKNGKVIFIDAYKFDDIAPVKEVKDSDIYYYDDMDSASVKRAAKLRQVVLSSNGVFSVGEKKLVAADDVIHFYNDYTKAIVRKDAKTEQKLIETHRDYYGNESLALEDKSEPWLNYTKPFRAVYSYEGKEFRVATTRADFAPIVGRKVKVLVALDGSAQLVQSDLAWNDGIQAIKRVTSYGDVNLLPPTGDMFWSKEDRDTSYYVAGLNNNILHSDFAKDDIVYYEGKGEEKDKTTVSMGRLFRKYGPNRETGYADAANMKPADIDYRYIYQYTEGRKKAPKAFRYFVGNLNAYALNDDDELVQIGDFNKFIELNKLNNKGKLEAFVCDEYELRQLLLNKKTNPSNEKYVDSVYNFLSGNKEIASKVARVVVFKGAKLSSSKWDTVYVEVKHKYDYTSRIKVATAEGTEYDVDLLNGSLDDSEYFEGDIIELSILKGTPEKENKKALVKKVVINNRDYKNKPDTSRINVVPVKISAIEYKKTYSISGFDPTDPAKTKVIYFSDDTNIFNNMNSGLAQIDYEPKYPEFVRNIRFVDKTGPVQGAKFATRKLAEGRYLVLTNEAGQDVETVKIENDTRFIDQNGSIIGIGPKDVDAFIAASTNREVTVKRDVDGRVLSVTAEKNTNDLAKDAVAKAKAEIEKLDAKHYPAGSQDADNIAEFTARAKKALKDAELEDLVEIVEPVTKNGTKLETNLKSKKVPAVTDKAKNDYYIITQAEVDKETAKKIQETVGKKQNDGTYKAEVTLAAGATLEQAKAAILLDINTKLGNAGMALIKAEDLTVTADGAGYKAEITVGAEKPVINYTVK